MPGKIDGNTAVGFAQHIGCGDPIGLPAKKSVQKHNDRRIWWTDCRMSKRHAFRILHSLRRSAHHVLNKIGLEIDTQGTGRNPKEEFEARPAIVFVFAPKQRNDIRRCQVFDPFEESVLVPKPHKCKKNVNRDIRENKYQPTSGCNSHDTVE